MPQKIGIKLLFLFLTVLIIKVVASFFMNGPFIFADEACIIQTAKYFIHNFQFLKCHEITGIPDAGTPLQLYATIISPIFLFFKGYSAYYAILVFNSLLFSSLVFPLFQIFKKFLKQENTVLLLTFVTLFLSQIFVYEKMLMTEGIFIVVNIWLLHFYLNSQKLAALIFAILASLIRPFGFMMVLAMLINEIIISKKNRKNILILTSLFIIITTLAIRIYNPEIPQAIYEKLITLNSREHWFLLFKAIKNQFNTYSLATFFIPLIIFINHIGEKDSKHLNQIRYFIVSLLAINFLISTQHIYGYFLEGNELQLNSRYTNISIIFIYIFSFIFLARYKFLNKSKLHLYAGVTLLTLFLLFDQATGKPSQNIDLSVYYTVVQPNIQGDVNFIKYINLYLLPLIGLLLILLLKNKRQLILKILIPLVLIHSAITFNWITKYPHHSEILDYFIKLDQQNITYVIGKKHNKLLNAWKLFSFTDNKIDYTVIGNYPDLFQPKADTDYIISAYDLEFPIEFEVREYKIYKNIKPS